MSILQRISLNIFLLKKSEDVSKKLLEETDYLQKISSKTGKAKIVSAKVISLGVDGGYGKLYIKTPLAESIPEWVQFFVTDLPKGDELKKLKNKSISALLIKEVDGRQFAIAFGHGRHLLDLGSIEYRFGIKVALNIIEPDSISSIDRQTFDASPRMTKTQTIKPSALSDYGVNTEQDLLRGVVGSVKKEYKDDFGVVAAGIDSLKLSVVNSLDEVDNLLRKTLVQFFSKEYLNSSNGRASAFAWVDNLQAVSDPVIKNNLDKQLWDEIISNNSERMFMAIPELVDWEKISGFAYTESQSKNPNLLSNSLEISELKASLKSGADIQTLKSRQIFMMMNTDGFSRRFSAYRCIYAELKLITDSFLYILNAGNWFKVEPSFEQQVNDYFINVPILKYDLPFIEYDHNGEGEYNENIAADIGKKYILLDRKLIQFGGNHSSIEVCDLYKSKPNTADFGELIHVKRGRGSSSLSHLFAQGLVSSTLLASEPDFIKQVNIQILNQGGILLPPKIKAENYDVVFAIIDGPAGEKLEIPFFSKVNLQNCGRSIKAFGFGIKFLHVPESLSYLAKKKAAKAAKTVKTSKSPKVVKAANSSKKKISIAKSILPVP